jgi:eukaryotic-like serine/threonine-protein kinase
MLEAGPMDVAHLMEVALHAADALTAAHAAGLLHGRLKPGNVFLTRAGQTKLLDFGHPPTTVIPDDPGYVTPDELLRHELDARSDLYGLGVVLHELAIGRRLFVGVTQKSVFDAILHEAPPFLHRANPRVPAGLDWIIRHALEKKRSLRYQSAAELRSDLEGLKRAEALAQTV